MRVTNQPRAGYGGTRDSRPARAYVRALSGGVPRTKMFVLSSGLLAFVIRDQTVCRVFYLHTSTLCSEEVGGGGGGGYVGGEMYSISCRAVVV